MSKMPKQPGVTKYQFEIDEDEWDEWKDTVPRSKTLDQRIRELLWADTEGRVLEEDVERDTDHTRVRESTPEPAPDREDDTTSSPAVDADDAVAAVVERVSDGWEDTDERLQARRAAARAVLQHAVDTGGVVGKAEAVEQFLPSHAVEGQNEETWWRKNIRPVLKDVGEYSKGQQGYVVDDLDE